jgi:beta-glucosidase
MCAYNKVNGPWACENKPTLTDVLRKQWNFRGLVVSDWGATHSTAYAAKSGLDLEMPDDKFFGAALKTAVENGDVSITVVNRMVHRILRTMFAYGLFEHPITTGTLPVDANAGKARQIAERGAVLLKNARSQLPLSAARRQRIAVIGADANTSLTAGGGSARVIPVKPDTPSVRSATPRRR